MDKTHLYIQGHTYEASKHSSNPKSTQVTLVNTKGQQRKEKNRRDLNADNRVV